MCIHKHGILSVAQIIDCLQISHRTFYRVLELWHTTGDIIQHTNGVHGHPRILHFDDIDYLNRIIKHHPDWFLDELLSLLKTNHFISAHFTTIHWELVCAGVSTKKLKKIAAECNENLCADYMWHIAQYSPEQVGFLDEVSKDEQTSARSHGWSKKGTCAIKKGVFVHGWHFSATGLLTINGMISNTVVEGSMTRDLFLEYLEFTVVCYCLGLWIRIYSYSTVSRCHYALHSLDISASWWWIMLESIIEKELSNWQNIFVSNFLYLSSVLTIQVLTEIHIKFLLPYSLDLNPIEEAFSKVKAFICWHWAILVHEGNGLIFDLMQCMEAVTALDAVGYFLHAGYF